MSQCKREEKGRDSCIIFIKTSLSERVIFKSDTSLNSIYELFRCMETSDNIRESMIFAKSIPLIRRCMREKISVSLLLSTLKLMDMGLIKEVEDLDNFMEKRIEINPNRINDVEKIRSMIAASYFK